MPLVYLQTNAQILENETSNRPIYLIQKPETESGESDFQVIEDSTNQKEESVFLGLPFADDDDGEEFQTLLQLHQVLDNIPDYRMLGFLTGHQKKHFMVIDVADIDPKILTKKIQAKDDLVQRTAEQRLGDLLVTTELLTFYGRCCINHFKFIPSSFQVEV